MNTKFSIYKGLQKPLIYKGFKGKFIAWGIASLIIGLVSGGLIGSLTNLYLGCLLLILIVCGGLWITFNQQKKGLHFKTRHKGIFIQKVKLNNFYGSKSKGRI